MPHRVLAPTVQGLAVDRDRHLDRGEVDVARAELHVAEDVAAGTGVVRDRVHAACPRRPDAAVDDLDRGAHESGGVEHVVDRHARPAQLAAQDERDLRLDAGIAEAGGGDRGPVGMRVAIEQTPEVGRGDAVHLLHGLGGESDLVPRELRTGREDAGDDQVLDRPRVG